MSNAEIAHRLTASAQMLQAKGENPFKVRAYRRAAQPVAGLEASMAELDILADGSLPDRLLNSAAR